MALQTKTISAKGSKGNHTFYLDVIEDSTSTANNTSSISYKFRIGATTYNWSSWGEKIKYTLKIGGHTITGYIPEIPKSKAYTIKSGSGLSIEHSSDGTKTIDISFSVEDNANKSYTSGDASKSGTMTLTTIPRASGVSGGSGNIGAATTISISRASNTFTHTLEYAFGSLTGTIATGVGTSYSWTIPTTFYAQIPNSNTGKGTITCKTYSGSTLIGTSTTAFTAKVVNSNPKVGTFTYKDNNDVTKEITGDNQRIIRNNSNLIFTVGAATALNSASITKYEVTFNGVTQTLTSPGDLNFGRINLSKNATATLKVTDSRGNVSPKDITVIIDDWVLPTGLIKLSRKNNFYSETYLKVDGTYSSLNGKNQLAIQYQYRRIDDKNPTKLFDLEDNVQTTLDLDNNYKWQVIVIVGDRIGETTYNLYVDRGIPIIFFDRLLNSVGINCFPTEEEELNVSNKIKLDGTNIIDLIYPVGAVYISTNEVNPSTLFGGTWEQIKDKFLLSSGATYTAGNTGGSATHTLTTANLPSHNHSNGSYKATGNFFMRHGASTNTDIVAGGTNVTIDEGVGETWGNGITTETYSHKIDRINLNASVSGTSGNTGNGSAVNHLPPYLVVYMWKRIG
jgi:hypothetical protein